MSKVRAAPCCVESADINWNDAQTPESNTFGDVYFSRDDGKAESEYVFLQQNNLSERWQELKEQNIPFSFTIVETGFGTGLNFLNAIALWRHFDFAPNQQLHFVSAEKYPIRKADLARALLTRWPELQDDVERLLSIYPPSLRGVHRREFATNINLTLVFEDAFIGFNNLQFTADAWFLDGFAPSKNPELWQTDLLGTLGCKSKHGTTFSTFSAVGVIRRSLIQNGFRVEKVKGFGRKREMLRGIFERSQLQAEKLDQIENLPEPPRRVKPKQAPWFVDAESNHPPSNLQTTPPNIAIIGAGLAGCFTARALHRRGASTTVFDQQASPGQEASGNPQGILYTKPGATYTPSTQFGLLSLTYAQHILAELAAFLPQIWHPTGVLQLAYQEKEKVQQQKLITQNNYPNQLLHPVSPEEASIMAGINIPHSGIFYPESGWVRPAELCKALLPDPIMFIGNDRVVDISNESNHLWTLTTASGIRHSGFTHVVIANSSCAKQFRETNHLPLKPIRGQTSFTPSTPYSGQLKTAVCAKGYIAPAFEGQHCFGATFTLNESSTELLTEDNRENIENLRFISDQLANSIAEQHTQPKDENQQLNAEQKAMGKVGFRCTTPDYLPIVGPCPDAEDMLVRFSALKQNALYQFDSTGKYHKGVYVNVGHGSKGLSTTPLAGEIIASHIFGEPSPISVNLQEALHPVRFLIRNLIKSKL